MQIRPDVPIIALIGRLNSQKGLDLVDYVIADIMREDLQLVCLGLGESRYINLFSWAEQNYPERVAACFVMDNNLAHRIYAGADIFLMPSAFEPCGLSQMIALRYGTVPVVRETGGLRDTVLSYNEFTDEGNGFSFFNYNAHDMLHVLQLALRCYHDKKDVWEKLQRRGMTADFSWLHSSRRYLNLYQKLMPALLGEAGLPDQADEAAGSPKLTGKAGKAGGGSARLVKAAKPEKSVDSPESKPAAKATNPVKAVKAKKAEEAPLQDGSDISRPVERNPASRARKLKTE